MATASYLDLNRCRPLPPSLSSLSACPCLPSTATLPRSRAKLGSLDPLIDGNRRSLKLWPSRGLGRRHLITAVARADPDHLGDGNAKQEVHEGPKLSMNEDAVSEQQEKASQLKKKIIFGLGIGLSIGIVVLAGGWVFTAVVAAAVFVGAREYFELVRSRGIAAGMTPPPRYVSRVCSVICALMPILTFYRGQIDVSVTSAAFLVAMALHLQRGIPRFAQLSSTMFGLFYCGYLPCFWVKLQCGLAVPALNTGIGASWSILLGGQAQWTVGLVATLISFSGIMAADTCAFMGGKVLKISGRKDFMSVQEPIKIMVLTFCSIFIIIIDAICEGLPYYMIFVGLMPMITPKTLMQAFGRTPLTSVSPKKTWEGTIAGLCGCIATTVMLSNIFCWPKSLLSAIAFGILNFFGSVFGDLTESMIKRDAGVKDSGSLIPGHGGILDRVDSYIFTGALAYSFVKTFLPLHGV